MFDTPQKKFFFTSPLRFLYTYIIYILWVGSALLYPRRERRNWEGAGWGDEEKKVCTRHGYNTYEKDSKKRKIENRLNMYWRRRKSYNMNYTIIKESPHSTRPTVNPPHKPIISLDRWWGIFPMMKNSSFRLEVSLKSCLFFRFLAGHRENCAMDI